MAGTMYQDTEEADIALVARVLNNVRAVIAEDKKQKQPLILRINESFLFNIARKAIMGKDNVFLMSIAGESASGKTTFVDNAIKSCLKSQHEDLYVVVRCDDYYKDASRQLTEAGSYEALFASGYSFDTPEAVDLALMKEHLRQLKVGRNVRSPLYDFITCESKPHGDLKKPAKLIINEGLYVLNECMRDIVDVKVYVFTPFEVIQDRWFKRAVTRGKTGEAAKMQFNDVNETAQKYIRPTMEIADLVINGLTTQQYIEEITDKLINAVINALK